MRSPRPSGELRASGDLLALAASLAAAVAYLVAAEVVHLLDPLTLGTVEFLLALPVVLAWSMAAGSHRQLRSVGRRDLGLVVVQSMLTVLAIALLWTALAVVPTTTAAILGRLEVVLAVVLGSLLLRDRLAPAGLAGGAVSFAGVALMRWEAPPEIEAGSVLVLASALFFALAEVVSTLLARRVRPTLFLLVRTPVVTLLFALALAARSLLTAPPPLPGRRALLLAAALALCGPILARAFYFAALARTSLSRAALVNQSQPLIVALLVLALHGRPPTLREGAGGALVLAGTALLVASRTPSAALPPPDVP